MSLETDRLKDMAYIGIFKMQTFYISFRRSYKDRTQNYFLFASGSLLSCMGVKLGRSN
jgi:hypothetical protein